MSNTKSTTSTEFKQGLSRRNMLKLMGMAGSTLFTGITVSQLFEGSTTAAQQFDYAYSHGNETAPDYGIVFPQNLVNSIVITASPENWQAMQDDLTNLLGAFGSSSGIGGRPDEGGRGQPPGGGVRNISFTEEDPIWVPVTISFNGETWDTVGFRYKGNSTLSGAWRGGSLKLGFKLNFDKFEDDYPEIDNQRFFGFDELSFSSNYQDPSYLHEKVAADIFRNAGIPAAQTAFYAVSLNYGEGEQYIGLYTAVEEIDDTVLETQFGTDDGNLYKPEGTGAAFVSGTFDEASFEKKTNEDEADFSDILALFDALHADTRTTSPESWRTALESVLDVSEFLQWLAVNTVIQNWDSYGSMAHNYYLYNNPATGLLTWIPWDNNEALSSEGRNNNNGSLDLTNTSDNWPLISYLVNDPVYHVLYVSYVKETIDTVFVPDQMTATYQTLHSLIAPYVTGAATGSPDMDLDTVDTFENSLTQQVDHANQRFAIAQEFVSSQT